MSDLAKDLKKLPQDTVCMMAAIMQFNTEVSNNLTNSILESKDKEIAELKAENARLEEHLAKIQWRIEWLMYGY